MKQSYAKEFLKDHSVAAISASGPHLLKRLAKNLDLAHIRMLVELGPGDGVATHALLPKLAADARYLAIEYNTNFFAHLQTVTDPRFSVMRGRAQDITHIVASDVGRVDAIIASIPFTYLSKTERTQLMADAHRMLRQGGQLIIFHQYSPLMVPYLAKQFGKVHVEFEPLNIFPCFVMSVTKKS